MQRQVRAARYWLRSGRAEADDRLEQWQEYLEVQETYAMRDSFRKVVSRKVRDSYRDAAANMAAAGPAGAKAAGVAPAEQLWSVLPAELLSEDGRVRLPLSPAGLKMAVLNAEQYAGRVAQRMVKAGKVKLPKKWEKELDDAGAKPGLPTNMDRLSPSAAPAPPSRIDYAALIRSVDKMDPAEFSGLDLDKFVQQFASSSSKRKAAA